MKLSCEAVQDLYVLYKEDELHPSVRSDINEHLETCDRCTKVYETGDNFLTFNDVKKEDQSITTSDKLDSQIKMKLKLRRMRIIMLFFISVVVVYSFFSYVDNRKSLLYEVSSLEQTVRDIYFQLDMVKWDGDARFATPSLIMDLNEKTTRIQRHLNMHEKQQLKKHPYQITISLNLTQFLNLLRERYKHGRWSERDEQALLQMSNYLDEYSMLLTNERLKLNNVYHYQPVALLTPFKGKELKEIHQQIDHLSYTYGKLQQFPNEATILTETEVEERARDLIAAPEAEVTYDFIHKKEIIKGFGIVATTIKKDTEVYRADWEAYTGRLLNFNNHHLTQSGELLQEDKVIERLNEYLPHILETEEFRIESLGINYNYSSNVDHQLYAYMVIPTKQGFDTNASYLLYMDARTGILASVMPAKETYYSHLSFSPSESIVDKEEGLLGLEEKYVEYEFIYKGTQFVPSILSNQYELVHAYEGSKERESTMTVFVNVSTGIEEVIY